MNEFRLLSANLTYFMDQNILKDSGHSLPVVLKPDLAYSY